MKMFDFGVLQRKMHCCHVTNAPLTCFLGHFMVPPPRIGPEWVDWSTDKFSESPDPLGLLKPLLLAIKVAMKRLVLFESKAEAIKVIKRLMIYSRGLTRTGRTNWKTLHSQTKGLFVFFDLQSVSYRQMTHLKWVISSELIWLYLL